MFPRRICWSFLSRCHSLLQWWLGYWQDANRPPSPISRSSELADQSPQSGFRWRVTTVLEPQNGNADRRVGRDDSDSDRRTARRYVRPKYVISDDRSSPPTRSPHAAVRSRVRSSALAPPGSWRDPDAGAPRHWGLRALVTGEARGEGSPASAAPPPRRRCRS